MKKINFLILTIILLSSILQADTLDECLNAYKIENIEKAEKFCIKALKENPKSFEVNFTLVLIYNTVGNYKRALPFAKKMEELSISFEDYSSSYNEIGTIYGHLGNKKQKFTYLFKTLEIAKKTKNRNDIGTSLHNIATYYYDIYNFAEAEKYYIEALKYKIDKLSIAVTYNSLAILNSYLSNKKSIEYLKKAVLFAKESNNILYYANYSLFLSTFYINNEEYDLAKPLLFEVLQIAENNQMLTIKNSTLKYLNVISKAQENI